MATNPPTRIALDTVVIIDWLSQTKGRYQFIKPIAKDAEEEKILIVVSAMAIAETLKLPGSTQDDSDRIIREFFTSPHVAPYAVGISVAECAQNIRRSHRLSGADAIHLASALVSQTPVFLTNDGTKKKIATILPLNGKLKHGSMTLRIYTPEQYLKSDWHAAGKLGEHTKNEPAKIVDGADPKGDKKEFN